MLVLLKAKVKLIPEDEMETLEDNPEMGLVPKGAKRVIREIAINSEDIKRIIRYNSKKTLVETYEGEIILVYETFDEVYKKWQEAIPPDLDLSELDEELE